MSNYRNRRLLDLAHEIPCQADFPHVCEGSVVPAHSNQGIFGRGAFYKSHDWAYAALCHDAHDYVDGRRGGWAKEDKQAAWLRAYIKTQTYIWENGKVRVA